MRSFTVRVFDVSRKDVDDAELMEHIGDAVRCWGGQYHPDNPLFHIEKVEVKKGTKIVVSEWLASG